MGNCVCVKKKKKIFPIFQFWACKGNITFFFGLTVSSFNQLSLLNKYTHSKSNSIWMYWLDIYNYYTAMTIHTKLWVLYKVLEDGFFQTHERWASGAIEIKCLWLDSFYYTFISCHAVLSFRRWLEIKFLSSQVFLAETVWTKIQTVCNSTVIKMYIQ